VKRFLILEDCPERCAAFARNLIGTQFAITSSSKTCIDLLRKNTYDCLFLDHDLGGEVFVPHGCGRETGHDVAAWLADNPSRKPEIIVIHTLNPVGAANMYALLPTSNVIPFAWKKEKLFAELIGA
jgi:CheY-like chemotaxis protein